MTPPVDRLIQEALAKSGVMWVTSAAGSAPVWYAHVESRAYILTGPGEQFCPDHRGTVEVVTRSKDTRARLASFTAEADVLTEADDDWPEATSTLKSGRLNAPTGDVVARWKEECTILRLTPDLATVVVRGETLPAPEPEPTAEPTLELNAEPRKQEAPSKEATERPSAADGSNASGSHAATDASPEGEDARNASTDNR